MIISIKKALLEGHTPEQIITEAKHVGTVYEKGTPLGALNRPILNTAIRAQRDLRETGRLRGGAIASNGPISKTDLNNSANFHDNNARIKSQMSNPEEKLQFDKATTQQPRLYQAAKQ